MFSRRGSWRLVPAFGVLILAACPAGSEAPSSGTGGAGVGGAQATGGTAGGSGAHTNGGTTGGGSTVSTGGAAGSTTSNGWTDAGNPGAAGASTGGTGNGQGGMSTGGAFGSGGATVLNVDASPTDSAVGGADAGSDSVAKDTAVVDDSGPPKTDGATVSVDGNEGCVVSVAGPFGVRSAHSAGYQGTLAAYSDLYNVACTSIDPCVSSCVAAGGTTESCTYGSECVHGTDRTYCLPPTYWRYEDRATAADGETAEQTLVKIAYQDPLLLRDFAVNLPADATIRGIAFDVLRGSDSQAVAVDFAVRVLRAGQATGDDKKRSTSWPSSLTYVTYGGPTDTWGVSWSAADVMSPQFGLSLAVAYTDTAGNARAYVDYARVSIYYTTGCQ